MRSSSRLGWVLGLVTAGSLLALPALASDDAAAQKKIEARLARAKLDQGADIQVEVRGGVATLRGIALTLEDRTKAESAARKEAKTVENLVRVFPEKRRDADIEKDLSAAILGSVYYGVFDSVSVAVQDGEVSLQGSVLQPYHKDEILSRVSRVAGIRDLKDAVRVQPASFNDDRLRRELYRKIYRDPNGLLVRFAGTVHPPVRILVENGHVTLTGYVGTPLEQTVVGNIARGTLAFSVDNQVQLERDRQKETTRAANES
jgi:osmotically-inducible protein OsmY